MEMPKASDADKEHFRSVVPDLSEVVIKPMFGNLGAFVNGNMFAGLFGPTIGVKLAEADQKLLESTERTVPFGPAERPMGGYTGLPEAWNADDDANGAEPDARARARAWVEKAFEHVAGLPPKAAKAPKAPKAKTAKQ
ncbi:TfoX/Sxy family protein [Arthrobacter sp. UYEF3]|uniref:TfoX/Sxy family protein n=1 Tax=Arthrobacter sp. UYEF3 TaxID=1756365 RepID=UPI003391357C